MKKLILPLLLLVAFGMLVAVESDPSEVVGYVKYPLVAGVNTIAIPMEQGFTMASNVGDAIPANTVSKFLPTPTEQWESITVSPFGGWDGTDWAVSDGDPFQVSVDAAVDFFSIGSLPAAMPSYNLVAGVNMLMVPLNKSALNLASLVGDDITANTVSKFLPTPTEQWESITVSPFGGWDGTDWATAIGDPLQVSVDTATIWPAAAKATNNVNTRSK